MPGMTRSFQTAVSGGPLSAEEHGLEDKRCLYYDYIYPFTRAHHSLQKTKHAAGPIRSTSYNNSEGRLISRSKSTPLM